MNILRLLLGKSLANYEESHQSIGPWAGLALLGLDGLSSSAYGPEAAATILLPLGIHGTNYVLPVTIGIIVLLGLLFLSYLQIIDAYPDGGGSYTVAKENIGQFAGLIAAVALIVDYILVVAVGISAGVGAIVSAFPAFQPHMLQLCLIILFIITLINLRGIKESGFVFMIPTYIFVVCLLTVIGMGIFYTILSHGHPIAAVPLPHRKLDMHLEGFMGIWLIAKSFSSGCTAMTGVEVVSNGTKLFAEPRQRNAKKTLAIIVVILAVLLSGIAFLAQSYGIIATHPGANDYQSLLSQLTSAVIGRGVFYYITMFSVITILLFSANTAFAGFPRLCQIISRDNFLPHIFKERGRRLVFSYGILCLAIFSGLLLYLYNGITDHLIPIFAIGAFLAFTLSQFGMFLYWKKSSVAHRRRSMIINLTGCIATGLALFVILISKFTEGGWTAVIAIPLFVWFFYRIKKYYNAAEKKLALDAPFEYKYFHSPIVIVPLSSLDKISKKALLFATLMSTDVYAVHVEEEYDSENSSLNKLDKFWNEYVVVPSIAANRTPPQLFKLQNPYRKVFKPLLDFLKDIKKQQPHRRIAVVIPELIEKKWYYSLLRAQRGILLRAILKYHGDPDIIIVNVPWYLD